MKAKLDKVIKEFNSLLEGISINLLQEAGKYKVKYKMFTIGINSSQDSLKGILELCKRGNIVDTYVLIRKIRDNLFLNLFLLADYFCNTAPTNLDDDLIDIDAPGIDINKFLDYLSKRIIEIDDFERENFQKSVINNWYKNKLSKEQMREYIGYQGFKTNLETLNESIKECNKSFFDKLLNKISKKLNNYVHSNGICYLDNVQFRMSNKAQNEFISIRNFLYNLMKTFMVSIFLINPLLVQAENYMIFFDLEYKHYEKYKYYIFPTALNIFEEIRKNNKRLFEFLDKNNINKMYIKKEDYI